MVSQTTTPVNAPAPFHQERDIPYQGKSIRVTFQAEPFTFSSYHIQQLSQETMEKYGIGWIIEDPQTSAVLVSLPADYERTDATCYAELMDKGAEAAVDSLVRIIDAAVRCYQGDSKPKEAIETICQILGLE